MTEVSWSTVYTWQMGWKSMITDSVSRVEVCVTGKITRQTTNKHSVHLIA